MYCYLTHFAYKFSRFGACVIREEEIIRHRVGGDFGADAVLVSTRIVRLAISELQIWRHGQWTGTVGAPREGALAKFVRPGSPMDVTDRLVSISCKLELVLYVYFVFSRLYLSAFWPSTFARPTFPCSKVACSSCSIPLWPLTTFSVYIVRFALIFNAIIMLKIKFNHCFAEKIGFPTCCSIVTINKWLCK